MKPYGKKQNLGRPYKKYSPKQKKLAAVAKKKDNAADFSKYNHQNKMKVKAPKAKPLYERW